MFNINIKWRRHSAPHIYYCQSHSFIPPTPFIMHKKCDLRICLCPRILCHPNNLTPCSPKIRLGVILIFCCKKCIRAYIQRMFLSTCNNLHWFLYKYLNLLMYFCTRICISLYTILQNITNIPISDLSFYFWNIVIKPQNNINVCCKRWITAYIQRVVFKITQQFTFIFFTSICIYSYIFFYKKLK